MFFYFFIFFVTGEHAKTKPSIFFIFRNRSIQLLSIFYEKIRIQLWCQNDGTLLKKLIFFLYFMVVQTCNEIQEIVRVVTSYQTRCFTPNAYRVRENLIASNQYIYLTEQEPISNWISTVSRRKVRSLAISNQR